MRVIFMGTPDFSVPILDALVTAGHDIAAVYCQPARPAGRGKKPRPSPVEIRARALGLEVRSPRSLKDPDAQLEFKNLGANIAVVVAYGLILPQSVLDAPRLGCLNIHASLLPRWRGAAPIHRAIMHGDPETGICIMQMEPGLDTGPVLLRDTVEITSQDTTQILHDRLSHMGADLIIRALRELPDLTPVPQPETGSSYATKIDKAEAQIDWARPAYEIDRQIRGLSPFPGAWSLINGERVKFLMSRIGTGSGAPGQVLGDVPGAVPGAVRGTERGGILDDFTIACGDGAVTILRAQRQGKHAMQAKDFLLGNPLRPGQIIGE